MKKCNKIVDLKLLYLKKIKKNEIEILRRERNLSPIRKKMLNQKIISQDDQIKWYKKIKTIKNSKFFSIYYKNLLIGAGSFVNIDKINRNCTWGFYIFKKYFGYFGVLAQYKIIEYSFKKYNLHKLYGQTLSTNNNILKIHKKFGFKIEGTLRQQIFIKNNKLDVILTSLFKDDWIKNKKKIKSLFT
jgi:UDP-4-amino-4,6-dideoxy-N-acetyl-beta-L-altrosamine N-acetyltransferase